MSTPEGGPSPERMPDELLAAVEATGKQLNTLALTTYAKGMRDGFEAAARIAGDTAAALRAQNLALEPAVLRVLDMLCERYRLTAYELPEPDGARSDG